MIAETGDARHHALPLVLDDLDRAVVVHEANGITDDVEVVGGALHRHNGPH